MRDGGADSLNESLTESFTHSLSTENAGAGAVCCQFPFQTLMQLVRMAHPVIHSECKGQRAVFRLDQLYLLFLLNQSYIILTNHLMFFFMTNHMLPSLLTNYMLSSLLTISLTQQLSGEALPSSNLYLQCSHVFPLSPHII